MRACWPALLLSTCALAQQTHINLDPNATHVTFTLGDVLHTVHGQFKLTKGDLWFDPSNGKAGGEIVVNSASGDSGSHARDSRMNKSVLQVESFPEITFKPDRIEGTVNLSGDCAFRLHGSFSIHGAGHELTMNVKSHIEGGRATAQADFAVPYVAWGMKDPSTLFLHVSNTVRIEIEATGKVQ